MSWPNGTVSVGEVFYDKLTATTYEKCILGPKGERGGTGEIFKALPIPGKGASEQDWETFNAVADDPANPLIMDVDRGCFVTLVRVNFHSRPDK